MGLPDSTTNLCYLINVQCSAWKMRLSAADCGLNANCSNACEI